MKRALLLTLVCVGIPAAVFAASSGTGSTMSGSLLLGHDTGALINLRLQELDAALTDHPIATSAPALIAQKVTGRITDLDRYVAKNLDIRTTCRDQIRRANRDTVLKQSTACLRGDLTEELSFLQKEKAYVMSLPGITPLIASGALASIAALTSADMTVVNAIDTHLYTQVDQLKDVKQKLTTQYRAPVWLTMLHLRADRNLTWLHYFARGLGMLLNDGDTTILIQNSALEAVECMDVSQQDLRNTLTVTNPLSAGTGAVVTQKNLTDCWSKLWIVAHLKERQEEAQTGSGTSSSSVR